MTKTASMNGLGNGGTVVSIVPAWEMAVVIANIVIGALLVICIVLAIIEACRNAKISKQETIEIRKEN